MLILQVYLPPGSLTVRPWKYTIPKGEACFPTIIFQGLCHVKLREGIYLCRIHWLLKIAKKNKNWALRKWWLWQKVSVPSCAEGSWTEVLVLWLQKCLGFWTAPSKHLENQLGIQTKSWFVFICILFCFVVPLSLYKSLMSFHSARRVELPKHPWWDERPCEVAEIPAWTWQKTTVILPSSSNAFSTSIHDEILAEVLGVFLRKGEISMPFVTQICVVFVFSLYGLQKITCWISISGGFLCSFIFCFEHVFV